jgi:hypothetical protein
MGTNGGCRCFEGPMDRKDAQRVKRAFTIQKMRQAALLERVAELIDVAYNLGKLHERADLAGKAGFVDAYAHDLKELDARYGVLKAKVWGE